MYAKGEENEAVQMAQEALDTNEQFRNFVDLEYRQGNCWSQHLLEDAQQLLSTEEIQSLLD